MSQNVKREANSRDYLAENENGEFNDDQNQLQMSFSEDEDGSDDSSMSFSTGKSYDWTGYKTDRNGGSLYAKIFGLGLSLDWSVRDTILKWAEMFVDLFRWLLFGLV